jgi:hypothetical protein
MKKQTAMKPDSYILKNLLGLGLIFLMTLMITACGAKIVRGASPMVRMTELSHEDNQITLELRMRNLNGVELEVQSIDFSLSISDEQLFVYNGPVETNIVANGTETWSVKVEESRTSLDLLNTLQNGAVKSLPYALEGSVMSEADGTLHFEHEGHIYPLPGRPGHFR